MVDAISQISVIHGPVPWTLCVTGALALLLLVTGHRAYVKRWVPTAIALSAIFTGTFWYLAEKIWNLWGEPQPMTYYVLTGVALFAVLVAVPKMVSLRRAWSRVIVIPAALAIIACAAGLINVSFEYYPTIGALMGDVGAPVKSITEFEALNPRSHLQHDSLPTTSASWVLPLNMPIHGQVVAAKIPGRISHEPSAMGYVYLPPAYPSSPRANLPVLVLIHGVPGGPFDWLRGGQVNKFMDAYAAKHAGLAPIVDMPDAGGDWAMYPPLCLDSRQGQGATYLTQDVPNWVKSTLGAGTDSSRQWAIGGFSYGGTCAMTVATNYPNIFPTFIDSSGESEPTIDQGQSVLLAKYFQGSASEFAKQNALDILRRQKFKGVGGIITVGSSDAHYRPQDEEIYRAMVQAGISVKLQ